MSELPKGWELTSLRAVCHFNPRHSRDTDRSISVSFVPMPAVGDVSGKIEGDVVRPLSEVWKGYTHFQDGDVIFAKITPCMENGKIAVAEGLRNGMACGSTEFIVLRPAEDISPSYIWRFLRQKSFRKAAQAKMTGAVGQRRVPKEYLQQHPFPLPPAPEQKRIVEKLDSLSARSARAREELSHIPRLVARYKQAILTAAFSGELRKGVTAENGGTAQTAIDNIALPKDRKIRRGIPETAQKLSVIQDHVRPTHWLELHLGKLIKLGAIWDVKDGNHGANHPKKDEFSLSGLPFITADAVQESGIDYESTFKVSGPALDRLRVGFSDPGDVILTHKGTVGRVAIATNASVLSPQTTYYRLNESVFDREFFAWLLRSPYYQSQLNEVKSQTTRDFVPIAEQYRLYLLVPPIDEQREIARRASMLLSALGRLTAEHEEADTLLDKLDQSILAKAFRGELVPQDPNDEPASVLLARIASERERKSSVPSVGRSMPHERVHREPTDEVQNMEKTRKDVTACHLSDLVRSSVEQLTNVEDLWHRSDMTIDEFYKQLRSELAAGSIRQDSQGRFTAS